jgi:hypothetical protein
MIKATTIIFYVLTEQDQNNNHYSFHICLECSNIQEEYMDKYEKTPQFYGVEYSYYPTCEWCNEEIKEGVELI